MSSLTDVPVAAPVLTHLPWWQGRLVKVAAIVGLMVLAYLAFSLDYPWPKSLTFTSLSAHLDDFQTWLIAQRTAEDTGIVFTIFNWFRISLDNLVAWFNQFLLWLTWIGTMVAATLVAWRFGGLRAAGVVLAGFASFALMGLWEASMETLALMLVSVGLALLIGVPIGVVAGRSDRFQKAISPFLDAMQIVPAFAYLMPVVLLFSIGYAAAVVSTIVFAIPPAVRITSLGPAKRESLYTDGFGRVWRGGGHAH